MLICEKGKWKWHNAESVPGDAQKQRGRHAACLIPVGKKVIVFGGMSEEFTAGGDLLDSASGDMRGFADDAHSGCMMMYLCNGLV